MAQTASRHEKGGERMNKCGCGHDMTFHEWKHQWVCHRCGRTKSIRVQTNADRIRAMSDEELAAFIEGESWMCGTYDSCDECPMRKTRGICFSVVEWLKQSVKDGEGE